jgi:hypothetical protein
MASATSVQDMVRPGEMCDIYYYDAETSKKQAFPTTQNTKYTQEFSNKSGGSSVFTIPPNNGVQDIVCSFSVNVPLADCSGLALPRGWGYGLIKQVSFRYGGSSQYFLTGDQILLNAVRKQPSRQSADDILNLGGSALTDAELDSNNYAFVVLTLPHNIPSAVNKANPLPGDLLTQQIQITVELNPVTSIFSVQTVDGHVGVPPTTLTTASFKVQQVMLNNQSDALARRIDMSEHAYAYPVEFTQQVQRINLQNTAGSQSVALTGFRSGEVKTILCWLTRSSDVGTGSPRLVNPFLWYQPLAIQSTYAGDIYARYDSGPGEAILWNLINGNKSPVIDNLELGFAAGDFTIVPSTNAWAELPFAQTLEGEGSMNTLVHGKPITNGIVNLDLTTPSAEADWVLNISYVYNATLLFSQGSADYVF